MRDAIIEAPDRARVEVADDERMNGAREEEEDDDDEEDDEEEEEDYGEDKEDKSNQVRKKHLAKSPGKVPTRLH